MRFLANYRMNFAGYVEDGLAWLVRWVLLAVAVWAASLVVGGIELNGWKSSLVVSLVLGLLNLTLRPLLFRYALPLTLLTGGIFLVVINAVLLVLTSNIADRVEGVEFAVDGPQAALLGALIISLVSLVLRALVDPERIVGGLLHFSSQSNHT